MHNAPSVTYPVGRSRLAGALLAAAWLAGAAATAAWAWHDAGPAWRVALGAGLLAIAGGWAWLAWWHSPSGELGWDGVAWRWEGTGGSAVAPAEVACAFDLQLAVLLLARSEGGRRWLWARRGAAPARWPALRRAVYSRARTGATPSPAKP